MGRGGVGDGWSGEGERGLVMDGRRSWKETERSCHGESVGEERVRAQILRKKARLIVGLFCSRGRELGPPAHLSVLRAVIGHHPPGPTAAWWLVSRPVCSPALPVSTRREAHRHINRRAPSPPPVAFLLGDATLLLYAAADETARRSHHMSTLFRLHVRAPRPFCHRRV